MLSLRAQFKCDPRRKTLLSVRCCLARVEWRLAPSVACGVVFRCSKRTCGLCTQPHICKEANSARDCEAVMARPQRQPTFSCATQLVACVSEQAPHQRVHRCISQCRPRTGLGARALGQALLGSIMFGFGVRSVARPALRAATTSWRLRRSCGNILSMVGSTLLRDVVGGNAPWPCNPVHEAGIRRRG